MSGNVKLGLCALESSMKSRVKTLKEKGGSPDEKTSV